jgi:ribosome-associated toxin RatA of RatAB toxin-antitoxin module
MTRIERQAIVGCPPAFMFALVNHIQAYPRWFPWCEDARILGVNRNSADPSVDAELSVRLAGVALRFSTRNRAVEDQSIALTLLDGPFETFEGQWRFEPLGISGCRVRLALAFKILSGTGLASAAKIAIGALADRLVDDFIKVAKKEMALGEAGSAR